MDTSEKSPSVRPRTAKTTPLLPEIDIYLHLLVLIYLLDQQKLRFVSINFMCRATASYRFITCLLAGSMRCEISACSL